jgi:hypothetical protein
MNIIEEVIDNAAAVLKQVADLIDQAVAKNENIGITALCQDIAKQRSLEYTFVYGVASAYIDLHPELICVKGKGGGVMSKSKYEASQHKKEEIKMEMAYSRFTAKVRELGFKDKQQFNAARRELGEHPTLNALKTWLETKGAAK